MKVAARLVSGMLVLSALALSTGPLSAQGASPRQGPSAEQEAGARLQWELDFGYGYGVDISGPSTELGDVRFAGVSPRIGMIMSGPHYEDEWYEGRIRLLVEVPLLFSLAPRWGYAAGATLVARYTISEGERLRPFGEVGVGPAYLDFNNSRNQSDGFSFTLQGGLGLMYDLGAGWAVVPRIQFHHISNAGLRKPNPGINDFFFTFGVARPLF